MQDFSFRANRDLLLAGVLAIFSLFILTARQASLLTIAFAFILVLVIGFLCWQVWHLRTMAVTAENADVRRITEPALNAKDQAGYELANLLFYVLPLWDKHVSSVKQHSETSVGSLLQNFSSIINEFEAAGFGGVTDLGQSRQSDTTITLLQLCKKELAPMIASFGRMIETKDELLNCIRELEKSVKDLNSMAQEVGHIADQTNLLAINAAIEAARVGVHGRGFAVVAGEVRKLSHMSAETGKRMTDRVKSVSTTMHAALNAADKAASQDSKVLEASGAVVRDVLSHVEAMDEDSREMRNHGNIIRGNVENLLVSLQFQDRISQMLDVISANIRKMQVKVDFAGNGETMQTLEWLEELQSTYTMSDEYRNHGQKDASSQNADSEITFF